MTMVGPWLMQEGNRLRRLDQFASGRGLAQRLPRPARMHQPAQQVVGEPVRCGGHQRPAEPDHRADAHVEPVGVPPAVAVGDGLLDRLAPDRAHPDLDQGDS